MKRVSNVFVDIRLKMHVKDRYNDSILNYELEDGFTIAKAVCSEIKGLDHFPDMYDVEVVKMGKVNTIALTVDENFLVSDE